MYCVHNCYVSAWCTTDEVRRNSNGNLLNNCNLQVLVHVAHNWILKYIVKKEIPWYPEFYRYVCFLGVRGDTTCSAHRKRWIFLHGDLRVVFLDSRGIFPLWISTIRIFLFSLLIFVCHLVDIFFIFYPCMDWEKILNLKNNNRITIMNTFWFTKLIFGLYCNLWGLRDFETFIFFSDSLFLVFDLCYFERFNNDGCRLVYTKTDMTVTPHKNWLSVFSQFVGKSWFWQVN